MLQLFVLHLTRFFPPSFCATVEGLKALYFNDYIHRDIKPDTILIRRDKFDRETAVLTDFGFAIKRKDISQYGRCGTPGYMAPEVMTLRKSSEKMDIYSLGITLIQMLSGSIPSSESAECRGLRFVTLPNKMRGEVSNSCWNLIEKMTMKEERDRMSYEELWSDPWICARAEDLRDAYISDRMACIDVEYSYSGKDGEEAMRDLRRAVELKRDINWPICMKEEDRKNRMDELSFLVNRGNRNDFFKEVILTEALKHARSGAVFEYIASSCAIAEYKIAVMYVRLFNIFCHTESSHLVRTFSARISMLENRELMDDADSSS